jgi:hypothetical protein
LGIGQFKISTLQISHYRTNTSARKMWVLQFVLEIENSMTPMGKPHHALKVPWFLFWGRGVGGDMIFSFLHRPAPAAAAPAPTAGNDFFFSPLFPNVPFKFPMDSHQVPNMFPRFLMCSSRVFPIAPRFNPICFAQSPLPFTPV